MMPEPTVTFDREMLLEKFHATAKLIPEKDLTAGDVMSLIIVVQAIYDRLQREKLRRDGAPHLQLVKRKSEANR